MFKIVRMTACLALLAGLAGCVMPEDEGTGAAIQACLGNDFTGNYVKVSGMRSTAADGKYPCLSQFELCLPLDRQGVTSPIKDLCPSDDTPSGTWAFKYVLYADKGCAAPMGNLACAPTDKEWLHQGSNRNDVRCITRNADKTFDFCVLDPVTGAGSEACPPCVSADVDLATCSPQ